MAFARLFSARFSIGYWFIERNLCRQHIKFYCVSTQGINFTLSIFKLTLYIYTHYLLSLSLNLSFLQSMVFFKSAKENCL